MILEVGDKKLEAIALDAQEQCRLIIAKQKDIPWWKFDNGDSARHQIHYVWQSAEFRIRQRSAEIQSINALELNQLLKGIV